MDQSFAAIEVVARSGEGPVRARSWFVLAAWMAISAVISASVPTHDWFNHHAGRYVLSMMAVWSGLTGLYVWLRERPRAAG